MDAKGKVTFDVQRVASRYCCHPSTVWRWAKAGEFPKPVKIGGATRWLVSELDAFDAACAAARDTA